MADRTTQRDLVLSYIRDFGSINSFQAYTDLGITQLGARIWELSHKFDYKFRKERVYAKNRYGKDCHYDNYFLVEE